jgi:hypothetical protein
MRARRELRMPETRAVPELSQLTQEPRRVVYRRRAPSYLPHIGLMLLHPGTLP